MKKINLAPGCDFEKYIAAFKGLGWGVNSGINAYNLQDGTPYEELLIRTTIGRHPTEFHFCKDGTFDYFKVIE